MFATPGRHQLVDKENVGSEVKTPGKSSIPLRTPARKPLARLNQDVTTSQRRKSSGKVLQKIWTPAEDGTPGGATPARKTPGRKSKSHRKSRGPSASSSPSSARRTALTVTEAAESILNEVLLQEIKAISHCAQEESSIESVETTSTSADGDSLLEQAVARLVKSTLDAALQELRVEQMQGMITPALTKVIRSESLALVNGTPTTESLWSIALGLGDDSLDSPTLLSQGNTSVFSEEFGYTPSGDANEIHTKSETGGACRLDATAVEEISILSFTPTRHGSWGTRPIMRIYCDQGAMGVDAVDDPIQMAPVRLVNVSSGSTPTTSHHMSQGTTPIEIMGQELATTILSPIELEASMQVVPVHTASASLSSIEIVHTSQGSKPVKVIDTSVSMTTSKTMDSSTETLHVSSTDVAIGTTPVKCTEMIDSSVSMTPIKFTDTSVETTPPTPVSKMDGYVMTTPFNYGTTPVRLTESSTVTTPTSLTDATIGTTPLKPVDILNKSVTMTPIQLTDSAFGTSPVKCADANYGTTPVKLTNSSTATTPTSFTNASIGTMSLKPIEVFNKSVMITPVRMTDSATIGTTPLKPVDILNKSVTMTPIQLTDSAFGTSPVKCADANYGTTPVKLTNSSTATTPTSFTNASIGTMSLKSIEVFNKSVMITPVRMTDSAFGTSPVKSADANCGTTPIKSAEIGLCTDPAQVTDSCTGTTPVIVAEIAVGTSPLETADAQCGVTPVRVVDTRCGTTPCSTGEVGTAITPLAVNAAETLTSPIVVPAFKLEAESPSQLDPASLMSHLESACISNELLRREIETLKTTQAELYGQLVGARGQLEQKEAVQREEQLEQRVEVRQMAKVSLQKDVEDLLLQVGEQMNQLALLQGALEQKSAELAAAQQDKTNLRDQYQKEIHNLQQDLRTAYKQHQQEVSDLRAFCEQNNYEPHYKRAMATVTELRTELQAYTDLKDTLAKAAEIQEQFGCIEEAYSLVNTLFTKTMDKRDELEVQHVEMVDQMNQIHTANEQLQHQLAAAEEQQQHLQTALDNALDAEKNTLECRGRLLQDLEESSQAMEEVKVELHSTKLELFGFRGDHESIKAKNAELHKQSVEHFLSESSLEAALAIQGKQWQDAAAEMETLRSDAGREIESLKRENTRLVAEATDLKHRLSSGGDLISSQQSELERTKETLHQQGMGMESMMVELEMNRDARADVQRMARQIQNLRRQFKENTEFLEEERVALVESTREAEDQLKVTSLELSRLKVVLYQAEETGAHWKGVAENLSEKIQFCQSELDYTKTHAHWMLLNQAAEMRDAAAGLTTLLKKIQNIYTFLNTGTEDQAVDKGPSKTDQQVHKTAAAEPNTRTQSKIQKEKIGPPSGSLVASILSAIDTKDRDTDDQLDLRPPSQPTEEPLPPSFRQQPRTPSPSESRLAIGGSGSSAFTAVQTSANQDTRTAEEERSEANEGKENRDDGLPLVDQVEQARVLFGRLLQVLLARNETLESSVQDLKEERCQLNTQILRTQKQHDRDLCLIREQLRESEMQERRLCQEVANSNTSLTEQQQALQYAQQRLQAMADNLERFSDQKTTIEKLQTETAKLTSSLRVAQREKNLLQEQLDNVLSSSSQSGSEGAVGGKLAPQQTAANTKLIKENLSLKKELDKLRVRLVERQEHYESLNARATRHVRVLEDNWHKADAEVYRLDELFDHCKQLMEQVPASSDEHSHMATLRELLS